MENWNDFEELNIIYENEQIDQRYIEYRLYETNFTAAISYILKSVLERKRMKQQNRNGNEGQDEKNNIFAFIGSRGSGKTTAMNEFRRIIKNMNDVEYREWWISHTFESEADRYQLDNESFRFHVLEPIDAGLLEDSEDMLELILSNIYAEYRRELEEGNIFAVNGSDIRETTELFEKMLRMYRSVRGRREMEDYSVSSMVRVMGSSREIAGCIRELVNKLFSLNKNKQYGVNEYFVISIDDLDLNLQHGYEILEQLQKYFAYYKIIVLVTMDYEQMWHVCVEHFHKGMKYSDAEDQRLTREPRSRRLANDYMTKVFPLQQRMFMPDMRKQAKRIQIQRSDKTLVFVKEYVMNKVAEKMRIFYDILGGKKHFCEPNTVRELVTYNSFLNSLIEIDYQDFVGGEKLKKLKGEEKIKAETRNRALLHAYDQNHERFNWDIIQRLAQTELTSDQLTVFHKLLDFDLERRATYFVKSEKRAKDGLIHILDIKIEERNCYCYGELLEKIYKWGRTFYEDKPFISCVIASFTSEMVREYIGYRYRVGEADRERCTNRLYQFLGNSFSNAWVGDIFPAMVNKLPTGKVNETRIGFVKEAATAGTSIYVDLEPLKILKGRMLVGQDESIVLEEWMKSEKIVEILECIDMFCINKEGRQYGGIHYSFGLGNKSESGGVNQQERAPKEKELGLEIKPYGRFSLDVMGFVPKSMDYNAQKQRLQSNIIEGLTESIQRYLRDENESGEIEGLEETIKKIVENNSMFKRWGSYEHVFEVAFPFYDLDLSYNLLKRIRNENIDRLSEKSLLEELLDFYNDIQQSLTKEANLYGGQMNYAEIFANCLYIKAIRKMKDENAEIQKKFEDALRTMAVSMDAPESPID